MMQAFLFLVFLASLFLIIFPFVPPVSLIFLFLVSQALVFLLVILFFKLFLIPTILFILTGQLLDHKGYEYGLDQVDFFPYNQQVQSEIQQVIDMILIDLLRQILYHNDYQYACDLIRGLFLYFQLIQIWIQVA